MTILGIDPGVAAGLAVCVFSDGRARLHESRCITTHLLLLQHPEVIGNEIASAACRLPGFVNPNWPSNIALEIPQPGPSMAVYGAQMRMIGAIVSLIRWNYSHKIGEVNPMVVKKTMTGYGLAKKDDMVRAAEWMVGPISGTKVEREAVADAVGHAVTLALTLGWTPGLNVMPPAMEKPPTKKPRRISR